MICQQYFVFFKVIFSLFSAFFTDGVKIRVQNRQCAERDAFLSAVWAIFCLF